MKIFRLAALACFLLPGIAEGQHLPAPSAGPALGPNPYATYLVEFEPGEVRCGAAESPRPVAMVRPFLVTAYLRTDAPVAPIAMSFGIDADGRPVDIADPVQPFGIYLPLSDLAPAVAASRFAPAAASQCRVSFTPRLYRVADAPIEKLYRYAALLVAPETPSAEVLARLRRNVGGDCFGPQPPAPLVRVFPDFTTIPQPPGTSSFTAIAFDLDAHGKPVRLRTLASDGNVALDRAVATAVGKSRYVAGARTGCVLWFHRRQEVPIAPPAVPDIAAYRVGGNCDPKQQWTLPPVMTFPPPFARRAVEGWSVIGYDVAPWGATGNVRVLASEPAAAFGVAARGIISQAKQPTSATGATGCADRVRFAMPVKGAVKAAPVPPPIVDAPPPF